MNKIKLSVFDHGPQAIDRLRSLLAQFQDEQSISVHLEVLPWQGGWTKTIRTALYRTGPDISEIGSTWLGDLARMNAFSVFSPGEISDLGGKDQFLPASYQSGLTTFGFFSSLGAIPWSADTRVVYYRRDLFAKAGLGEPTSFSGPEEFEQALARLQDSGVEVPLTMATGRSRVGVHLLASWVWGAGGAFISQDGQEILFDRPEARRGMKAYFRLGRYLSEEARELLDDQSDALFLSGRAATVLSGHWLAQERLLPPELRRNVGVALLPGVSFVGGLHLVIWKHSRRKSWALKLIQFLLSDHASGELFPSFGLPTRIEMLDRPPFSTEPHYQVMGQALKTGRSFPGGQAWGLVESQLTDALPAIWHQVLPTPRPDLDGILTARLEPLAQQLALELNP
ncbi:MAG: extracellular solute-binding protein [Anaerolineae bacterium]|jgi:multiple sugar transport system substrate-binding protein